MNTAKKPLIRRRLQFSLAGLLLFLSASSIAIFVLTRPAPLIKGEINFNGKPLEGGVFRRLPSGGLDEILNRK